jgi:hypothetical protein
MRLPGVCAALVLTASAAAAAEQAVNADLIRLHDALRLTAAQDGAWRDYTVAIASKPDQEGRRRAADEMMAQLPTPRRIALIESEMARDEADFRREGAAVIAFYQQLTPEQQRIFDAETLPRAQGEQEPQPRR